METVSLKRFALSAAAAAVLLLHAGAASATWRAVGSSLGQRVVAGAVNADLSFVSGVDTIAQFGMSVITVRNTDPASPITLNSLKYYSNAGVLVKNLLAAPVVIPKLGSARFEIGKGTVGVVYPKTQSASTVLLEWQAAAPVRPPAVASALFVYRPEGTGGAQFMSAVAQVTAVIAERQLP